MILLDTTVLSGLMQREPDRALVTWLDGQPAESIWTTSITVFEIRTGLELLEPGRRQRDLQRAFEQLLAEELGDRIQAFEETAALAAATIAAQGQRAGHPMEIRDAQIAGIAKARNAKLASRNVRHFDGLAVNVVNPWSA